MKKTIYLLLLVLLLVPLASALTPPTGGISYYNFSSVTDLWGSNDGTAAGSTPPSSIASFPTFNVEGNSSPNSYNFVKSNQGYVELNAQTGTKSFSFWIYNDVTINNVLQEVMNFQDDNYGMAFGKISTSQPATTLISIISGAGNYYSWTEANIGSASLSSAWRNYIFVWDGVNNYNLTLDGVNIGLGTAFSSPPELVFTDIEIGRRGSSGYDSDFFDGKFDEVKFFSTSLTSEEINNLYDYGIIDIIDYSFSISAKNIVTGLSINNFSAVVNGTNYNTTNGTIITSIYNSTSLINLSVDSVNFSSATENNYNVSFDYIATLYPENTINITFYDELNSSLINYTNISVELISDDYSYNYTTSNGSIIPTLIFPSSYYIRYTADNYAIGNYYFSLVDDTYNTLSLFMIPIATSDNLTVNVFDTLSNAVVGANIKLLKYFVVTNTFSQVSAAQTNFEGKVRFPIEKYTEFYKFLVEYESETVLTTTPTYITGDEINLYVNLLESGFDTLFSNTGLYGKISYLNTTNILKYVYDDEDNIASGGCFYAYRLSVSGETLVNTSCGSGSASTVYMSVANVTGVSYKIKGYITKGGNTLFVTDYLLSFGDYASSDVDGLILAIILLLTFIFVGFWRLEIAVILAGVSIFTMSLIKLIILPLTMAIPIFVLSFVIAVIIRRSNK